jgi:hypothetical protein
MFRAVGFATVLVAASFFVVVWTIGRRRPLAARQSPLRSCHAALTGALARPAWERTRFLPRSGRMVVSARSDPRRCSRLSSARRTAQASSRLCLSLNEDVSRLAVMSDLELQSHVTQKPSPVRRFRASAAPTLTAFFDAPGHMLDGGSIGDIEDRARRVKGDAGLRARLVGAYTAAREPYALSPHLEERIYNGFSDPADEARITSRPFMIHGGRIVWPSSRAWKTSACAGSGFG